MYVVLVMYKDTKLLPVSFCDITVIAWWSIRLTTRHIIIILRAGVPYYLLYLLPLFCQEYCRLLLLHMYILLSHFKLMCGSNMTLLRSSTGWSSWDFTSLSLSVGKTSQRCLLSKQYVFHCYQGRHISALAQHFFRHYCYFLLWTLISR